jgi:hypothetical protein
MGVQPALMWIALAGFVLWVAWTFIIDRRRARQRDERLFGGATMRRLIGEGDRRWTDCKKRRLFGKKDRYRARW